MKRIQIFIVLVSLSTLLVAQGKAQRFAIKSGHVTYQLTGNTTGTKSLWWDDFGNKTREEENTVTITRILGMRSETKTNTVNITKGNRYWSANLDDKTGQTGSIPYIGDYQDYNQLSEVERKQMEDDILASFGGSKVGTERIMGHMCDIIDVMGTKSWIHKGILLKSEAKVLGITINQMANKFEPNTTVAASRFEPPSGIQYQDIEQLQRQMFGSFNDEEYADDEEDDDEIIPVTYPFNKFRDAVNAMNFKNMKPGMITSADGQHMATLVAGSKSVSIVATGSSGTHHEDYQEFETFTRGRKKYHYGRAEEGGYALIEEYPAQSMYIVFYSATIASKEELLEISQALKL
jgi:hypothetical protein